MPTIDHTILKYLWKKNNKNKQKKKQKKKKNVEKLKKCFPG